MVLYIDNIIDKISAIVRSHELGNEGEYARWIWQDENNNRDLGINEYGCADAVNILYTIGEFPNDSGRREKYIKSLQRLQNPDTGFLCKNGEIAGTVPIFHHLAGSFHYLFNHEYAHRPIRYPEKMIDTCLDIYEQNKTVTDFGNQSGFAEIDWIYCIG